MNSNHPNSKLINTNRYDQYKTIKEIDTTRELRGNCLSSNTLNIKSWPISTYIFHNSKGYKKFNGYELPISPLLRLIPLLNLAPRAPSWIHGFHENHHLNPCIAMALELSGSCRNVGNNAWRHPSIKVKRPKALREMLSYGQPCLSQYFQTPGGVKEALGTLARGTNYVYHSIMP